MLASWFNDERMQSLAIYTAVWMVIWSAIIHVVAPGKSGRNHMIMLNAAHGIVSTVTSCLTIYYDLQTTNSVAISVSYFLVDLTAMVRFDGVSNLHRLNQSRLMDYMHHVFGIGWGLVFYQREAIVCDARVGNPYVWIQTNEVSTGFYNWFRFTGNVFAGVLFALTFFLSRIVFNTFVMIPMLLESCNRWYLVGTAPFFILQYIWFVMIMRKMKRALHVPEPEDPTKTIKKD